MGQVNSIFQYGTVDSTNTVALSLARGGAPSGTLVTATAQTAGRGREGRVFHSAPGGIYTTLIVRPKGTPEDWMPVTVPSSIIGTIGLCALPRELAQIVMSLMPILCTSSMTMFTT